MRLKGERICQTSYYAANYCSKSQGTSLIRRLLEPGEAQQVGAKRRSKRQDMKRELEEKVGMLKARKEGRKEE